MNKKAVHIMEIRDFGGKKEFYNKFDVIDSILLHAEVKNRKIVIMSIIGEYRKGKSFFLDYCLRFMYANYASVSKMSKPSCSSNWMGDGDEPLSGFSWKHGRAPDTKGILFWPDVFLHEDDSGEKIAIIIMDTQGLFEIGSTQKENSRIFGLSTLISSIQIINIKDLIQESQIEYLEMATSLTKFIAKKQIVVEKTSEWKSFQKLLFLIRDWSHEEIEGGFGYGGGSTYLNEFMNTESRQDTKAQSIRKQISESFDGISCFLLNSPGEVVMNKNFTGEWSKLDKNFVTNLKILIESILGPNGLRKKTVLGSEVNASEFRNLLFAYLNAFRDTKLPEIENIFQMTIDNQMKSLVADQLKVYQTAMNENIDLNRDDFESWINRKHKAEKVIVLSGFSTMEKLEDEASTVKYQNILSIEIENSFGPWRDSIMREYRRYQVIKKQMDQMNVENSKYKEVVTNLEADIRKQALQSARSQQELEDKMRKQSEQSQELEKQVGDLNLKAKEKEEELNKIREFMILKSKENEESMRKQQELHRKQVDEVYQKLEKVSAEKIKEHEKILMQEKEFNNERTNLLMDQMEKANESREKERKLMEILQTQQRESQMFQDKVKTENLERELQDERKRAQEKEEKLAREHKAVIDEINREKEEEIKESEKEALLKKIQEMEITREAEKLKADKEKKAREEADLKRKEEEEASRCIMM